MIDEDEIEARAVAGYVEAAFEKVAIAIWDCRRARLANTSPKFYLGDWDGETKRLREDVRAEARAAIKAFWTPNLQR